MKDPAFLFYSKDFYEGTRMMLPEERAAYIDLLVYQHQHGFIPKDTKKLTLYCSGVCENSIKATLEAKFKLCEKGYYNQRLRDVVDGRKEFAKKQSINGKVGQFWKNAKSKINSKLYKELRQYLAKYSNQELYDKLENNHGGKQQAMLEAMLKHLVNANEDVNVNVNSNKPIPEDSNEVRDYFCEKGLKQHQAENEGLKFWNYYSSKGWLVGKSKMKNWKSAASNWILNIEKWETPLPESNLSVDDQIILAYENHE